MTPSSARLPAQRFPKSVRVLSRVDFLEIQQQGRRMRQPAFTAMWLDREERTGLRLGITITKAVGSSPTRNRIRRWIREVFRRLDQAAQRGGDVVILVAPAAAALPSEAARAQILAVLADRPRHARPRAALARPAR